MPSSILPSGRSTILPITPTDGQRFIDAEMVQWIYNAKLGVWERRGTADELPLATLSESGLMSPQDKNLLDGVPAVGGGFGIIADTKLLLQSPTNPEGVITGDIVLKSDSLDIACVSHDKIKLTCAVPPELECNTTALPGLLFKLSDAFLDTLFVDLRGPKGKRGFKGDRGKQGDPGYSEGPQGDQGKQGETIAELCELTGISYNDIDGTTDTAIVDLNLVDDDGHGCKFIVTKAKLNVPEDRPADKISTAAISRSVVYDPDPDVDTCDITRLKNWKLAKPPGDTTPINMQLLRLPKASIDVVDNPTGFNGTMTLANFVSDVVAEYEDRLEKLDKAWGKQVKSYIESIDDTARGILSSLANDLAICEFNLPAVEYCITFAGCGSSSPAPAAAAKAGEAPVQTGNNSVRSVGLGNRKWDVKL